MNYLTEMTVESKVAPGVRYMISRCSFAARLKLLEEIGQMSNQLDFARAGESASEQLSAAVLNHKIEAAYLRAGLLNVEGLTIDGHPATPQLLLEKGPEKLCREALDLIRAEFELSEAERKNF